jgi:hypothetical protein
MQTITNHRWPWPVVALLALAWPPAIAFAQPEPGPENGGLRLRLAASPRSDEGKEGYDVRLNLVNSSEGPRIGILAQGGVRRPV